MKQYRRVKTNAMLRRASVVRVEPGDLVLLRLPSDPTGDEVERARTALRRIGSLSEADVLVVGPGTSLQVIRKLDRGTA